ncbi:ceramide synthase 2-like [Liolophura sinensis]|uniref:ceramide synthase 2-like n=1 Tax=Liolophura sinensis TaxID=3198878 RepID=UPI003158C816
MALTRLRDGFWSERLWLPKGVSWKDVEGSDPGGIHPKPSDLYITLVIGVVFLVLRYIFETFIVQPIGTYFGVKDITYRAPPNPTLEAAFQKNGKTPLSHKEITGLAKQVDWSEIKVQRWLRKRRLQTYQFVFYTISSICGAIFMWDNPWLWETKKCWEDWPNHPVSEAAYWYYILEMGFYFSLLFTFLMDSKRKDFYEMMLHHLITLGLMAFSWSINFVHIGTLVLVVHDISDPWLQLAKMLKYAQMQNACEIVFTIFIIVWLVTRIFYYPIWLLYTCLVELPAIIVGVSPVIRVFMGFMVALQLLHIMWTYYVLRVALQRFTHGELTHDTRSDSEGMSESADEGSGEPRSGVTNNVKSQNNCSTGGQ